MLCCGVECIAEKCADDGSRARRLPLSRIYAGYFGGSLDLVTLYGEGSDVFVVLRIV